MLDHFFNQGGYMVGLGVDLSVLVWIVIISDVSLVEIGFGMGEIALWCPF